MTAAQVAAMSTQQSARQLKKERLELRRAEKPHHDILRPAKQLWETARTSIQRRRGAATRRLVALRPAARPVCAADEQARLVAHHPDHSQVWRRAHAHRRLHELQRKFVDLSMSPYGRFLVVKLFKYSSVEQRSRHLSRALRPHRAPRAPQGGRQARRVRLLGPGQCGAARPHGRGVLRPRVCAPSPRRATTRSPPSLRTRPRSASACSRTSTSACR
jgi:hypothetical protein